MNKTAYIFPGQGSQYPGMAKDLYENNEEAKALLEQANDILGFRITDIMFDGTADDLKETRVTQPTVFLHSYVAFKCLADKQPDMVAGHSLGEFSALAASGALNFADALTLVSARAAAMQRCCDAAPGAMAAVINCPAEKIEEICAEVGDVAPANYNSDAQIVISGKKEAVDEACARLKAAGVRRAIVLPVGGAFHSALMEPARAELAEAIEKVNFSTPVCPVYQNVTAQATTDPEVIKSNILQQLTSSVKWTQSVRNMLADGAAEFVEFGPGEVLQGLVRKIAPAEAELTIRGAQQA